MSNSRLLPRNQLRHSQVHTGKEVLQRHIAVRLRNRLLHVDHMDVIHAQETAVGGTVVQFGGESWRQKVDEMSLNVGVMRFAP